VVLTVGISPIPAEGFRPHCGNLTSFQSSCYLDTPYLSFGFMPAPQRQTLYTCGLAWEILHKDAFGIAKATTSVLLIIQDVSRKILARSEGHRTLCCSTREQQHNRCPGRSRNQGQGYQRFTHICLYHSRRFLYALWI